MELIDGMTLAIRLWLGVVMVRHGINHARSLEGTANWFASKGFRSADLNARMSAYAEIAIGAGLAAGFLTSFATLGLVATMFVAFWTIHRFAGFFNFARPDEGYEYVTTLALTATLVATLGPGTVSVDHAIGIADTFDGGVGLALAAAGVVAGFGQTLVFWSRPDRKEESV